MSDRPDPHAAARLAALVRSLPREEKLRLLAQASRSAQEARRAEAAIPVIAPDGSRLVKVPDGRGAILTFRLSADDLML